MSRTLATAREAFVAAIKQDTPGTDLPRLVAVLDALIAWSVARPDLVAFRASAVRSPVLSFGHAESRAVLWSAQVVRGSGPKLELYPPNGRSLSDDDRRTVLETLNSHTRHALVVGDRLRIGFGALKNAAAQAAVLALMERLLPSGGRPAAPSALAVAPVG